MPQSIAAPADLTDVLRVADWLELSAFAASDHNSSVGDLTKVLKTSGVFDAKGSKVDEAIDAHGLTVFSELEARQRFLGDSYPFTIAGGVLTCSSPASPKGVPYLFCLCLANFGDAYSTKELKPRLLFEELSAWAAAQYIGGEAFIFGTSRSKAGDDQSKGFKAAVSGLCGFLGEGGGFRQQAGLSKKDDHIDVVAVKHFADKAPSKLILFGQCASGVGWRSKVSELQPKIFWDHWIERSRVSEVLRSFFIPFSVETKEWDYQARYAGLFFDRVRLSFWAAQSSSLASNNKKLSNWIEGCLKP